MDKEFKKPYEYIESKRGFTILFIAFILSFDVIQTLSFISKEYNYLNHNPILGTGLIIIGSIFILCIIYTAIIVYRMKANFVVTAKSYIIIRTLYFMGNYVKIFYNTYKYDMGDGKGHYISFKNLLQRQLITPLIFLMSFSLIWYLYFMFSKRCRTVE